MGSFGSLHLSAAWTSHNTPAFRLRGRTLELTAAGFSTGIEGGAAQGLGQGATPPCEQVRILNPLILYVSRVMPPTHMPHTHICSRAVAMAARLVSPYPLVWSTGLARAGVGCQGALSDQVLAGRPRRTGRWPARRYRSTAPCRARPRSARSPRCRLPSTVLASAPQYPAAVPRAGGVSDEGGRQRPPESRQLRGPLWIVSAGYRRRQAEGGVQPRSCQERESAPGSRLVFNALSPHWRGTRRRQRWTRNMVHGKNRIPYWIDRRLTGLAGSKYHAIISFGLPIEPEDSRLWGILGLSTTQQTRGY